MINRPTPGAAKFIAPLAFALAFMGARPALAQGESAQPDEPAPAAPASEPTAPAEPAEPAAPLEPGPKVKAEASPVPAVAQAEAEPAVDNSWYERAPLTLSIGEGKRKWALTFYGFVEADFITDSTRSYSETIGGSLVARSDTYAGKVGRSQFSVRNTRLGLKFESPESGGVRPSAVLEGDFYGASSVSETSEHNVYTSPTFRLRHAYLSLDNDVISVLAGQTYDVFGWQNYFFPMSAEFLGIPNQVFSRNTQFRLSHTFGAGGPVSIDIAASAVRPAQRDSSMPDANLFWDATPAVRFGLSGQYTQVKYLDNDQPHNLRGMALALYAF